MICCRFGAMRKEIVPDNLLHFGGTAGAKRGVDAGCRRAEGGAPYRALSVAIGRGRGGKGEGGGRGGGGGVFFVGVGRLIGHCRSLLAGAAAATVSAMLGASVGVCFQLGGASPGVSLPGFHLFRYAQRPRGSPGAPGERAVQGVTADRSRPV